MDDETPGDPDGWVDRHGDGLYRYALLRVGDPDRAADLVQETFLHALRSFESFSGRSSERTWLIGILKHKIIDQVRTSARRESPATMSRQPPHASVRSEFDPSGHWRTGPASWTGEPGRLAETREFWETLGSCLAKLPPGLADAFLLRELDGETSASVQERLAITRPTSGPASTAPGHCSGNAWKRPGSALGSIPPPLLEPSSERLNPAMGQPREIWRLLNLPCRGMTRLASESLDRDLGRIERVALRTHLLICAPCRRYFRQIKTIGQTLRRFTTAFETDAPTTGPTLPDEVRERIKRRLEAGE